MISNKQITINALGIQDSGGITVLKKMLIEIVNNTKYSFYIFLYENKNTSILLSEFKKYSNLNFKFIKNRGLIYRVLFENSYLFYFNRQHKINFVYNFSGTVQFISNTKQLVKVHNLLFYSKKLDNIYFKNYLNWIKHIFIKRIFFKLMLKASKNIEIQSNHVKNNLTDYLNIYKKTFFIKNDFDTNNMTIIKNYNMTKKITFIYIVGPHFTIPHKNIKDFILAMTRLNQQDINFDIKITLTKNDLYNSGLWNSELDKKTKFLGYISKGEISNLFTDNSILVSTSIIETLGLHVIEATIHGLLTIVPDEVYSKSVYGDTINTYKLFDIDSLVKVIEKIILLSDNEIKDIIRNNQKYLVNNENTKYKSIINIFEKILKDIDV